MCLLTSFQKSSECLMEQHRVSVSASRCRSIFLRVARATTNLQHSLAEISKAQTKAAQAQVPKPRVQPGSKLEEESKVKACEFIAEADGVMVPIVYTDTQQAAESMEDNNESDHTKNPHVDKRKRRNVAWKEARTAAVCGVGSATWKHVATFSNEQGFFEGSYLAANLAGYTPGHNVHVLSDGATWIQDWGEEIFGSDAQPTIDMYHLLEYAAAAGRELDQLEGKHDIWTPILMEFCRSGSAAEAARELKNRPDCTEEQASAVFKFVRYVGNRPGMFAYDEVRSHGLPVGSGKIESTNRQVVQRRMKLPGAWWHTNNVDPILHLLTCWYNDDWDQLWAHLRETAA